MNNLFKERLNEIIKESGATQSKIVKTTKINKGALSCYLKGLYSPKIWTNLKNLLNSFHLYFHH